ncbi:hypothetical protein EYC84_003944 [Monilinia fructicola]|uniref:Peptidase A2 domain-containing protein n=1 Tax=Monilinia fructicola TaxID=38448 RepID=A0A5M9JYR3_MONFR|nr:hypothetical protein EYC84_003944 [Monilinia fructicola]
MTSSLIPAIRFPDIPREVARAILSELFDILSPVEVFKLRIVSKLFNEEILDAYRQSYKNEVWPSGPVNKLIASLLRQHKRMSAQMMGHLIYAKLQKEPQLPLLSPIDKAIRYICERNPEINAQVGLFSFRVCETVANNLHWSADGSLGFLERRVGPDSVLRHMILKESDESLDCYLSSIFDEEDAHIKLSAAVVAGDVDIFNSLLSAYPKLDINKQNRYFGRLLHLSALWGRTEFLKLLLDKGADTTIIQDQILFTFRIDMAMTVPSQGSILQIAAKAGHFDYVQALMKGHYIYRTHSSDFGLAILGALKCGHEKLARYIWKTASKNIMGSQCVFHRNPLFRQQMYTQACYSEGGPFATSMLKKSIGIDIMEDYGYLGGSGFVGETDWLSPVELACVHGHHRLVRKLLDSKVKNDTLRNKLSNDRRYMEPISSLQIACTLGHEEAVQILLDNGTKLDSLDVYLAFVQASRMGQVGIMKLFLKNGLDLNMKIPNDSPEIPPAGRFMISRSSIGGRAFISAFTNRMTTSIYVLATAGVPLHIPDFSESRWLDLDKFTRTFYREHSKFFERLNAEIRPVDYETAATYQWEHNGNLASCWPLTAKAALI